MLLVEAYPTPMARASGRADRESIVLTLPGAAESSTIAPMELRQFVEKHEPRPPAKDADNTDQLRLLTHEDGVVKLGDGGAVEALAQAACKPGTRDGRCLWVIAAESVPSIVEVAPNVRVPLTSGVAKHTNLTGGGLASCGGECWVDPSVANRLWVTGGSGRYPPRSPEHLDDAVAVIRRLGYDVMCAGWSTDNDCAERVFRET